MRIAKLKAAGIPRANLLAYGQAWAPIFFQAVADQYRWNDYAAIQQWGNLQEVLEEDASAALEKW